MSRRRRLIPQMDALDDRKLLSFAVLDPATGIATPAPLVTAAQQNAALAICNEIDREAAAAGVTADDVSPWWSHLGPMDPQFIPRMLGNLGIDDPFAPTEVVTMPTVPPPPVDYPSIPPFPWMGIQPPPPNYSPYTGQLDPTIYGPHNATDPVYYHAEPN